MPGRRKIRYCLWLMILSSFVSGCTNSPAALHYDFEDEAVLDQLPWQCKTVFTIVHEHAASGAGSLRIDFYPDPAIDSHYPGIQFPGFNPDWRPFSALKLDLYNPHPQPIQLAIRIDDRTVPPYGDRSNTSITLVPGANRLTLPLNQLRTAKTDRTLDLAAIQKVYLFLVNPPEIYTLYLDNLRLE